MKNDIQRQIPRALTAAAVAAAFGISPLAAAQIRCDGSTVDELQEQLIAVSKQTGAIRARAGAEKRDHTAEERAELDDLFSQFETIEARLQMANEREDNMTRAQVEAQPDRSAGRRSAANALPSAIRATAANGANRMGLLLNRGITQPSAHLFGRTAQHSNWQNSDEFFALLQSRMTDPRLIADATNVEGTGVDGGFIVPPSWYTGMIDSMLQQSQLASRCRLFGTPSNNINVPMLNTSDRRTTIAGIAANWVGENTQGTAQKLQFRLVAAKLQKIMILAEASNELLEDGIGYAAQLDTAMSGATAYTLDAAILEGTGVGQPLGILNSSSAIDIAPEAAQTADTIVYQNLVNMFSRAHPVCQRNGVWIYSPNALPQLLAMTIPGSDGHPVLLSGGPNDAAAGAPAQTIFGRPAMSNECMPVLGDRGDLIFVDLSQYALLMKSSARVAYSGDPGFDRDVATWRLTLRADGLPMWDQPITPRNGGDTLGWATVLQARA